MLVEPERDLDTDRIRRQDRVGVTSWYSQPHVKILLLVGVAGAVLVLAGIAGLSAYWLTRQVSSPATAEGADFPIVPLGGPAGNVPAVTAMPRELLENIKSATVFIKVDAGAMGGSGSGFLIKSEGNSGYVVTNHHVITPPADENPVGGFRPFPPRPPFMPGPFARPAAPTITLVFRSGTPQERSASGVVVLNDPARDLALLRVTGVQSLPAPIQLVRNPQLAETMPVFLFGFPFGDALTLDNKNPAITVGKGSVSSIRLNERGNVARIQIDGDLNPGNSGGPVVDAQGRLVGIAVAKVKNTNIGLAIPPDELITMLDEAVRQPR
jgi:S1-C subfamily serine protease